MALSSALKELNNRYKQACHESGESPVALDFELPPGIDPLMQLKLRPGTLDGMIRMLAAMAGLECRREGARFVFEKPTGEGGETELKVSPDFLSRLASLAGREFPSGFGPKERLAALGLPLDPESRITFRASSSSLDLGAATAADQARVAGFVKALADEQPVQHKLQTKLIRISPGLDWEPEDHPVVDGVGVDLMLRKLAQMKGVDLISMPSVMARSGEEATVTIDRLSIGITSELLGFGEKIDATYVEREELPEASGGEVEPAERSRIELSGFTADAATRMKSQPNPDGSRTLLLVTPTAVDPTGRPFRRPR
ncbi:hypothetical protein [Luteolibacter marinus]|uniref:hypothetical protein n=1 Tax=Luteolibacter marinus TaxID=2776705 RepID=UPI001D02F29E|nr:hypothetical protein [Luteolibacter marinus]